MHPMRAFLPVSVAVLSLLLPTRAMAQDSSLERVRRALKPGRFVTVQVDGQPVDGQVIEATPSTLTIARGYPAERETIALDRLEQVTYDDTGWDGALGGFVLGALPGLAVGLWARSYCRNEGGGRCDDKPYTMTAVGGGLGALLGAVIDSGHRTTVRLTRAPHTPLMSVAMGPRGAGVVFRF